jgi:DNA-directed RNA polymerase specialized sigma subunit
MELSDDEAAVLHRLQKHMSFEEIAQELGMTAEEVFAIGTAFFDRAFEQWRRSKN